MLSPTVTFAISQITAPAGAATTTARAKTNKVLSKTERTITDPIFGLLYDGISKVYEDGIPLSNVTDKNLVIRKVIPTPKSIVAVKNNADIILKVKP